MRGDSVVARIVVSLCMHVTREVHHQRTISTTIRPTAEIPTRLRADLVVGTAPLLAARYFRARVTHCRVSPATRSRREWLRAENSRASPSRLRPRQEWRLNLLFTSSIAAGDRDRPLENEAYWSRVVTDDFAMLNDCGTSSDAFSH